MLVDKPSLDEPSDMALVQKLRYVITVKVSFLLLTCTFNMRTVQASNDIPKQVDFDLNSSS